MKYPQLPVKIKVREFSDGSLGIPRRNRQAEAILDRACERIPNQLRWWPLLKDVRTLMELKDFVQGRTCYVIAKGPSLDNLTEDYFGDGVIITLNEAIQKVETLNLPNPIIAIQQDPPLGDTCWSKKGCMLVAPSVAYFYWEHPRLYTFARAELNLADHLSACVGIAVANLFEATDIKMLCFDAYTHKNLEYAKCIGHPSSKGGIPERFLKSNRRIDKQLAISKIPYQFITPGDLP